MDETQMTYEEAQTAKNLHQTVARGKYYWDPDEEEFRFFLRSIHHAVLELLQAAERAVAANDFDEEELKEFRFPYQVRMFQYLAMQFIRPVECLKKLARPDREDSEGRKIYTFRAFLGEKGKTKVFDHISQLRQGDLLYPASLLNNRILVADRQGRELGYLSLEDDALYFCLIPLLKAHKAQVRMEVGAVEVNRRRRPMQVKANVTFQFRVDDREDFENTGLTEKISKMIDQYKQMLKEAV